MITALGIAFIVRLVNRLAERSIYFLRYLNGK